MNNQTEQKVGDMDFEQMKGVLGAATARTQLETKLGEIKESQQGLLSSIASGEERDIFKERLSKFSILEVQNLIKNSDFVESFFKNADGTPVDMSMSFASKEREFEFKRDMIVYFRQSMDYEEKIDTAIADISKEYEGFEQELSSICDGMSDNLLMFIVNMKEKAETLTGERKAAAYNHIKHIESAYNMQIFKELVQKYPSVIHNTYDEFNNDVFRNQIMDRYKKNCTSAGMAPLLYQMYTQEPMSFEARYLIADKYHTPEGLFLYILMRYFAYNKIEKLNLKLHSAISINFRNIYKDRMIESIKDKCISSIYELLGEYTLISEGK